MKTDDLQFSIAPEATLMDAPEATQLNAPEAVPEGRII